MNEAKITFYPKDARQVSIICEISKSFREKMKGMMNRVSLPENRGMIFPFFIPGHRLFWMKNVLIPLDIIFINRKMEIIYIHEAPVEYGFFQKIYWSHGFCKYVIETNIGFCKKHYIKKGDKIKIKKREEG